MKTITVTGTKGKTTVVHMLDYFLRKYSKTSIRVDSTGSYVNGKQTSTLKDSITVSGRAPNVRPGRYLYGAFKNFKLDEKNTFAVLESSFACSKWGTGLENGHDLGIFLNVLTDHLNFTTIKNRKDILQRKSFSLFEIRNGGAFIFNAEDKLIRNLALDNSKLHEKKHIEFIPIFKKQETYKKLLSSKLKFSNYGFINPKDIMFVIKDKKFLVDRKELPYTFNGNFVPILQNYLIVFLSLSVLLGNEFNFNKLKRYINSYKIPSYYGRALHFNYNKRDIIIDYAHEIESLKYLINVFKGRKITVVTRLAYDRNDEYVHMFSKKLAKLNISKLIIFDKVDGIKMLKYVGRRISRKMGETATLLKKELDTLKPTYPYKIILNEEQALKKAINESKKNEVIIHIQSDTHGILKMLKNNYGLQ